MSFKDEEIIRIAVFGNPAYAKYMDGKISSTDFLNLGYVNHGQPIHIHVITNEEPENTGSDPILIDYRKPTDPELWLLLEDCKYAIVTEDPKKYDNLIDIIIEEGRPVFDTNPYNDEITSFYQKKAAFFRLKNSKHANIFIHCNSDGLFSMVAKRYLTELCKLEIQEENKWYVDKVNTSFQKFHLYKSPLMSTGLVSLEDYYYNKGYRNSDLEDRDVLVLENGELIYKLRSTLKKDFPFFHNIFSTVTKDLPAQFHSLRNTGCSVQYGGLLPKKMFDPDIDLSNPNEKFFNVAEEILIGLDVRCQVDATFVDRNGEFVRNEISHYGCNTILDYRPDNTVPVDQYFEFECTAALIYSIFETVEGLKLGHQDIAYYNRTVVDMPVFSVINVNCYNLFNRRIPSSDAFSRLIKNISLSLGSL